MMRNCCQAFHDAQEDGTDNEAYQALIEFKDGRFIIGTNLPALKFCPWCGKNRDTKPKNFAPRCRKTETSQ